MYTQELQELVLSYNENKTKQSELKKEVSIQNSRIKEIMGAYDLCEFSYAGLVLKRSLSERPSFDDDTLISILQGLEQLPSDVLVPTWKVDMGALEKAIMDGLVDPNMLTSAQKVTVVESIRISKGKKKDDK